MPELPEVHTILQDLKQAGLLGCSIQKVLLYWPKTVAQPAASLFCRLLRHKQIIGLDRRGKYLILSLSQGYYLCIHLRMTGRLLLVDQATPEAPHVRLRLELDRGKALDYHDTRKFGRWHLTKNLEEVVGKIGPEPLSPNFTFENFWNRLHPRSRALKPLLLDQTFLAGLGNIYVDEALWQAQLHPLQSAHQLTLEQARHLYQAIRYVLKRGIESQGTTLGTGRSNYYRLDGTRGEHQTLLNIFRRTGEPCPRCGHLIERLVVAQRSTHICPYCQPKNPNLGH
ncbi:MAG: DNA-formamidopyrimidine glycosylase [Proteobacteria bacterium]|nr:DNA-formamidopyrimidine glycosylase [Pseudomonadota bacterium]